MSKDLINIEVGDLIRATGPVWAVDPDLGADANITFFEGNTTVFPKGTIMLVINLIIVKSTHHTVCDPEVPVANVLVGEKPACILSHYNTEIIRKAKRA